ncbi:hypothetical protein DWUX_1108 [Desulfovibrio diazotrophicus]|nr:hypothetical protein DWUX_1108 [Desulfovibrio diazotrophicus]
MGCRGKGWHGDGWRGRGAGDTAAGCPLREQPSKPGRVLPSPMLLPGAFWSA